MQKYLLLGVVFLFTPILSMDCFRSKEKKEDQAALIEAAKCYYCQGGLKKDKKKIACQLCFPNRVRRSWSHLCYKGTVHAFNALLDSDPELINAQRIVKGETMSPLERAVIGYLKYGT